jgi:cellulose synthase/poly-beta-1,6-N-acetylglucosamine synthase-like glycosyltransferase
MFFLSLIVIFYIYIGYPLLVFIIAIFRNKAINKNTFEPYVTILIPAHNEERNIQATLENKLGLDYPKEKLEIFVISDGSTDNTDRIAKRFQLSGVQLIRQEPRKGKTSALNLAVPRARGEILVFSDANSIYDSNALRMLVQNFIDPQVGYVTGKMVYINTDGTAIGDGCTAYMQYENFLRKHETKIGSIVGVDGGIDAVRKELYSKMKPDQLPDFVLPLKVVEKGYRVVYEPDAILKEFTLSTAKDEYRMRVRVSLRAFWGLNDMRRLLFLGKNKLFAFQLWSHKVLRYLCFIFFVVAYLTNCVLWSTNSFYKAFFIIQNLMYAGALISPVLKKKGYLSQMLYLCNYFVLINLASAQAFFKFLFRQKQIMWTPRKG